MYYHVPDAWERSPSKSERMGEEILKSRLDELLGKIKEQCKEARTKLIDFQLVIDNGGDVPDLYELLRLGYLRKEYDGLKVHQIKSRNWNLAALIREERLRFYLE